MAAWTVVRPDAELLEQVAALRFHQNVADGHEPVDDEATFTGTFSRWAVEHESTHLCRVALDEHGEVIGFGFVAVSSRPPSPHRPSRCSGDVQSFFVRPGNRDAGVGRSLLEALVEAARGRGVEHLTVHSSPRAAALYRRAGFDADPLLMYREGGPAGDAG